MISQERRSFLIWAINALNGLFIVLLGAPVLAYLADPRNRTSAGGGFRPVQNVRLGEIASGHTVMGVIRDIRRDAWTLYPSDVIGRVWIVKGAQANDLTVFTTVCPHLGCSINKNTSEPAGFTCPCHNAQFQAGGECVPSRADYNNPSPRSMDTLEWRAEHDPTNPDPANRDLLLVNFLSFRQGEAEKIVKT